LQSYVNFNNLNRKTTKPISLLFFVFHPAIIVMYFIVFQPAIFKGSKEKNSYLKN